MFHLRDFKRKIGNIKYLRKFEIKITISMEGEKYKFII